ncbi:hypothetical protein AZE42_02195 [Rhizopogon vesiculosus]|uniref:F-box domain-containing protein n=1 Tax=Rhizopogon vesiculosus TaxID=180088 RepID=A0A1J8QFC9_9AGAM|nr:hypothetical protein AZE42_02195 [Rhizopogon vesiculosus]
MTVEKKTEHRAEFLSLPQELQCYILEFIPWRDILRFTSIYKALHQMYMSSCELQYVVELGGQRLLPLPDINLGDHVTIPKRLQLLREKSRAWLRFNIQSSKSISIPKQYYDAKRRYTNGHLLLLKNYQSKIFPILPESSQHIFDRDCIDLDMSQNLIAIAYVIDETLESDDKRVYIELEAPDGDGAPPQADLSTTWSEINNFWETYRSVPLPGLLRSRMVAADLGLETINYVQRELGLKYFEIFDG